MGQVPCCSGKPFATAVRPVGAAVEVLKCNELHTFVVLPKRWVVERSLPGWKSAADSGRTAKELNTSLRLTTKSLS